jgi:uncharacterized membrane protein
VAASVPRVEEDKARQPDPEEERKKAERVSREELYAAIRDTARLSRVYLMMVAMSTMVAAVGLLKDNVPVVIGAMVIAPLLGPIIGLALATTLGDVLVALASGFAGALAFTSGAAGALIGVMVAVALLPPLVNLGLLLGSGFGQLALGALLLVATNMICINLAGVISFWVQGIRPTTWWEENLARRATGVSVAICVSLLAMPVGVILLSRRLVPSAAFWGIF